MVQYPAQANFGVLNHWALCQISWHSTTHHRWRKAKVQAKEPMLTPMVFGAKTSQILADVVD